MDSPADPEVPSPETPPSTEQTPEIKYSLSGMVSGSTVTGATIQLIYPNGNFITKPASDTGYFTFDSLGVGDYTLNIFYRGYMDHSIPVTITGDTVLPTTGLKLLWGNAYDTWGKMAGESFNYF